MTLIVEQQLKSNKQRIKWPPIQNKMKHYGYSGSQVKSEYFNLKNKQNFSVMEKRIKNQILKQQRQEEMNKKSISRDSDLEQVQQQFNELNVNNSFQSDEEVANTLINLQAALMNIKVQPNTE